MVKLLQVIQPKPVYNALREWSHMISAEAGVNESRFQTVLCLRPKKKVISL